MDTDTKRKLTELYVYEGWGQLAIDHGFDPVNTEASARHVLRLWADEHKKLEMATKELIEKAASYLMFVTGDWLNPDEDVDHDEWMHSLSPMERIEQVKDMLEGLT